MNYSAVTSRVFSDSTVSPPVGGSYAKALPFTSTMENKKIMKKNICLPLPRNRIIISDNNHLVFCYCFSLFSDLRTMSGTALMYMLANLFLTQLFYVVGVGGVQVTRIFIRFRMTVEFISTATYLCERTNSVFVLSRYYKRGR